MKLKPLSSLLAVLLVLVAGCQGAKPTKTEKPPQVQTKVAPTKPVVVKPTEPLAGPEAVSILEQVWGLPEFIQTMRGYGGGGYDQFQCETMKQVGLEYVQGLVDFSWIDIQRGYDAWKWAATDAQMDALAQCGLKTIAFILTPKLEGLHWDESVRRDDPRYAEQYGEFAYQVVNRYHNHSAWSGLVTVWGGSSDVWGESWVGEPEVVIPLMNAAYDGIKRADPNTIVVGFNMATTFTSADDWRQWHERAFALNPKFDWFGVQSHGVPPTMLVEANQFAGLAGLTNVRRFLDEHGYADKPMWLNEGGFRAGAELGGLPEDIQAQYSVETFILARTIPVDLRGWVYFAYFAKSHDEEDYGIMTSLDQADPPQPRQAWTALKTLFSTMSFFGYNFDSKMSGDFNQSDPYVLLFVRPESKARLWVIFSPRFDKTEPASQQVTINIAPASQATLVMMLGEQSTVSADANGNVTVTSTASPIYILAGQ